MNKLVDKIKNKIAIISVIGLGYVGLPLAVEAAKTGYHVVGIDINIKKVDAINACQNFIPDIINDDLSRVVNNRKLMATHDFKAVENADVIIICVPTPLDKNKNPTTKYIEDALDSMLPYLRKGQLLILESTTYPGTTEEIILPRVKDKGLKVGEDFYLVFSPERIDPGNKNYKTGNIPKIVGGVTPTCTEAAKVLYENITIGGVFTVSSPRVAEMEKLLENIFRIVNISLVNEMAMLCDRMGIDIWEVIEAAKTKPYGYMPFYPGPGTGGHCIPLDPFYLSWKAKEYDFSTRFIELAGEINDCMPEYVLTKISDVLNENNKCLKDSNILIIGVAYKKDINDTRESPALKIATLLLNKGVRLQYHDPYVSEVEMDGRLYHSQKLTSEVIKKSDLVLITTDHSKIDYTYIIKNSKIIYDTRNALKEQKSSKIYKLGSWK